MFSTIKYYLYAAVAAVVAGLMIALKVITAQKQKAQQRADRQEQRAETTEAARIVEQDIVDAQAKSRKEAQEHAQSEKDRIDRGDRPDSWGDDRLR